MDMDVSIKLGTVAGAANRAARYAAKAEGVDFAAVCGGRMSGESFARIALEAALEAQADLAEAIAMLETQTAKEGARND